MSIEENGIWYIYDTNDKGGITILDKGNERNMTNALYRRLLKLDKKNRRQTKSREI